MTTIGAPDRQAFIVSFAMSHYEQWIQAMVDTVSGIGDEDAEAFWRKRLEDVREVKKEIDL